MTWTEFSLFVDAVINLMAPGIYTLLVIAAVVSFLMALGVYFLIFSRSIASKS